jgi:hypothetical protein
MMRMREGEDMDTNANTNDYPQSAAEVWALFRETDRLFRRMEEDTRKLKKRMDATDKQLGKLGNRFGDMVEHLIAPGLPKKFKALGYRFNESALRSQIKDDVTGRLIAEIDLQLTDREHVMAVEVKAHPNVTDVDEHVERLERIRAYYDSNGDKRKILGAVAGAVFPENVRSYARKNGFYTIVQSGDTVSIDVPKGFQPREW